MDRLIGGAGTQRRFAPLAVHQRPPVSTVSPASRSRKAARACVAWDLEALALMPSTSAPDGETLRCCLEWMQPGLQAQPGFDRRPDDPHLPPLEAWTSLAGSARGQPELPAAG
jgi:hypothetical protein